jgi:hypothetical protein
MCFENINFCGKVDLRCRCETSAGAAGQVRPKQEQSDEEAHRPPRGKQPSFQIATKFTNTALLKDCETSLKYTHRGK